MDCHMVSTAGQLLLTRCRPENVNRLCVNNIGWNSSRSLRKLMKMNQLSMGKIPMKQICWKICCTYASLEEEFSAIQSEEFSDHDKTDLEASPDEAPPKPLGSEELQLKEDALVNFKSELAAMELEIEALVTLAEEIAKSNIPEGTRKINGKYIQSHLLSGLEAVREKLKEQIKDVDVAQSKKVHLFWYGVAESVQVMGSFDGWSQGEHLSPEYTGSYTKFSTTLMLRPGRYEIKFLVDGEWQLSPEFPTVGEGLTENNLLIVE